MIIEYKLLKYLVCILLKTISYIGKVVVERFRGFTNIVFESDRVVEL